jgi:hypothetical protein
MLAGWCVLGGTFITTRPIAYLLKYEPTLLTMVSAFFSDHSALNECVLKSYSSRSSMYAMPIVVVPRLMPSTPISVFEVVVNAAYEYGGAGLLHLAVRRRRCPVQCLTEKVMRRLLGVPQELRQRRRVVQPVGYLVGKLYLLGAVYVRVLIDVLHLFVEPIVRSFFYNCTDWSYDYLAAGIKKS